jgi:osmotically-inducible protein OsmY
MSPRTMWAGAIAAALLLPATVHAQDPDRAHVSAREPSDAELHDAITETRVRSALLEKLGDDALSITVRASGEKVHLRGHVQKRATAELSKEVALSVNGVKDVEEDVKAMEGKGPFTRAKKELKDAALESFVKNRVLAEVGRNAFRVEIEATEGVVSLRGGVARTAASEVLRVARETKGVRKVVDLLDRY